MTSQTDNIASNLLNLNQNATKGGTGQAGPGPGGILTPDATPEVDQERTNADLKRRQEAASQDDGVEFSKTRKPHPDENPADEEMRVVQDVLKSGSNEHRKILEVDESYENMYVEADEILAAFQERGQMAHPNFNKHEDAEKAFKMILEAGAALGVDEEEIQKLKEWDGKEDEDREGMEGVEVPKPHKIILAIYQRATPHLAQLQKTPKSKLAPQQLDLLNDEIKKQNEKDGLNSSDQWIIKYREIADIYQKARPALNRIWKDRNDPEAKKALEEHSNALSEIIRLNHYLLDWNINVETAGPEKSRARATSPATAASTTKPPASGPAASTTTPPASGPAASTTTPPASAPAASTLNPPALTPNSESTAQEAPALLQAAQKIQSETLQLWANMGWSTHKMNDGDTILSHKPLSREGKDPYAYEFTVMTQDSPYFQIKLGSEVGRQERDAYLALPNIYKIITDTGAKGHTVYTWRQRPDYVRLLWTATKPRKQTQAGKNPRTGDTKCCVLWKNGTVSEMSKANFTKVVTEGDGKKAIEKYCKSVEIKVPWEMDPKTLTVSAASTLGQQLLQAGRTGSAINLNSAALKVATSNAENPETVSSSVQNSLAALQMSMQAMASGFEQSQILMQQQMKQQQLMQSLIQERLKQQEDQQMQFSKTMEGILSWIAATATSQGSTSQIKEEPVP